LKVLFGIPTFGQNELARKASESTQEKIRKPDKTRVVKKDSTQGPLQRKRLGRVRVTRNQGNIVLEVMGWCGFDFETADASELFDRLPAESRAKRNWAESYGNSVAFDYLR